MDIDAIKGISLVDFLHRIGYDPTGRDSKGLWFYAPYRNERKPSFHVNPRKNVWFDFGTGEGGDIFTLAGVMSGKTDFVEQARYIAEKMDMPVFSNVLQYFTADGTKVSIRPSGTEPKIKFYIEVHDKMASADDYDAANERADKKIEAVKKDLGI